MRKYKQNQTSWRNSDLVIDKKSNLIYKPANPDKNSEFEINKNDLEWGEVV